MNATIWLAPRRTLLIRREADGMFSCALQEVVRLPGVLLRTDRWLGGGGDDLGITTGIVFDPRLEAALVRLSMMNLARPRPIGAT